MFLKPFWKHELLLFFLLIFGNISALASPYILKIIIDEVLPSKNLVLLRHVVLALLGIYLLRIFSKFCAGYLYAWISSHIMHNVTIKLYSHIIELPLSFFRRTSVGDLVHRMNNEVGRIQTALTGSVISLINNLIIIVGLIAMLCILQWKLFLSIALIYPLMLWVVRRFDPHITNMVESIRKKESEILGHMTERTLNIKSIKTLDTFSFEKHSMNGKLKRLADSNIKSALLSTSSRSLTLLALSFIPIIVLGWGGYQVIAGITTLGTLIAFLQYANKLHGPFQNMANLYVELINTSVSIRRIFELLAEPVQHSNDESKILAPKTIEKIRFDHVSISHLGRKTLDDICLTLEIGKHYAIVGASGSGKTTLIDLLCKLQEPDKGTIFINDTDLMSISFSNWMRQIAIDVQGTFLMNDTLEENLKYGNFEQHQDKLAAIMDLVDLSNGQLQNSERLQLKIGDAGSTLSGGQRQKISVARVLLRKAIAEIFVMDESLSEIDARSEEKIYNFLFNQSAFKTILVVSHRLSPLKYVDEIICIDQGRVIEQGSFIELLEKQAYFYHLFREQLKVSRKLDKNCLP